MDTQDESLGDVDLNEFQKQGHELIDWIADYLGNAERYPVLSRAEPGDIKNQLPASPPEQGESLAEVFHDVESTIVPGLTHWNHPNFLAYFAITGSAPGILGELLSAAFNVNGMLWATSPAATELEETVVDWLRQILGLPEGWFGLIQDTASVATLCALAAARESLDDLDVRERGLSQAPPLTLYTSAQAHSSIDKAGITLGIGHENVRRVPSDDRFRMQPDVLARMIETDRANGKRPFAVVATVGTTSTTSVDPVPEIADVCARHGLWLHVDAAYAGAAAVLPEKRQILDGCDRADSFVANPHKWLFTPIDCSVLYTARPDVLKAAFRLVPEYLRTDQQDDVTNLMDYGVALGRRFRALKLWYVLRAFGVDGIRARIREHIRLAEAWATWVDADPQFERLAPVPFSTVCFRACPNDRSGAELDELNERLLARVNATGEAYLSHTRLDGRYVLRAAIGHLRTTEAHLERIWSVLQDELHDLLVT